VTVTVGVGVGVCVCVGAEAEPASPPDLELLAPASSSLRDAWTVKVRVHVRETETKGLHEDTC
jgi:hypothetical protein